MYKTVYVLGAGFSSYGGIPIQKNILNEIINLKSDEYEYNERKEKLLNFLQQLFSIDRKDVSNINLEDIFTILDKAIINNEFIKNYSPENLKEKRNLLNFCLTHMFSTFSVHSGKSFYAMLCSRLVELRVSAGKHGDPFSILDLNWDATMDDNLDEACDEYNYSGIEVEDSCFIDYGTYTNFFEGMKYHVTSSQIRAKGFYNIKLLKLHGSFRWFLCSNCNRLFINGRANWGFSNTIECNRCNIENSLRSVVISPTLLKDLNNLHLKTIWHNAAIELMEAKKVIFIGYSFPLADYEFRYLVKRAINADAEIDIVLLNDSDSIEAFKRYRYFFGKQIKNEYTSGCEDYFKSKFCF